MGQEHISHLCFDVCHYKITASMFVYVLSRWFYTPPDNLFLTIIQPKKYPTPAIKYNIENKQVAFEKYITYQGNNGHPYIIESVDSINRDERGFPLMQYITNGIISRARNTITHFKHHHRVQRRISNRMSV